MRKHVAWFRFAKKSWIALAVGWLSLLVAFLPQLALNQAGALLICAAIVAEVFHAKRHRLFVNQVTPGPRVHYVYQEIDSGFGQKSIEITPHGTHTGKVTVPSDNWTLYHLAAPDEFYAEGLTRNWDLERTMARAERMVDNAIIATTILGTILWAFT